MEKAIFFLSLHAMTIEYVPQNWKDYELLDSGRGAKLERFGEYVLARPEPKALWDKSMRDRKSVV